MKATLFYWIKVFLILILYWVFLWLIPEGINFYFFGIHGQAATTTLIREILLGCTVIVCTAVIIKSRT